jgi:hypothetical protein
MKLLPAVARGSAPATAEALVARNKREELSLCAPISMTQIVVEIVSTRPNMEVSHALRRLCRLLPCCNRQAPLSSGCRRDVPGMED